MGLWLQINNLGNCSANHGFFIVKSQGSTTIARVASGFNSGKTNRCHRGSMQNGTLHLQFIATTWKKTESTAQANKKSIFYVFRQMDILCLTLTNGVGKRQETQTRYTMDAFFVAWPFSGCASAWRWNQIGFKISNQNAKIVLECVAELCAWEVVCRNVEGKLRTLSMLTQLISGVPSFSAMSIWTCDRMEIAHYRTKMESDPQNKESQRCQIIPELAPCWIVTWELVFRVL